MDRIKEINTILMEMKVYQRTYPKAERPIVKDELAHKICQLFESKPNEDMDKELREKIARFMYAHNSPHYRTIDFELLMPQEQVIWYTEVDQILALIKEAGCLTPEEIRTMFETLVGGYSRLAEKLGYVKLAEDQSLPENPYDKSLIPLPERVWRGFAFKEGIDTLLKAGWSKVEVKDRGHIQ